MRFLATSSGLFGGVLKATDKGRIIQLLHDPHNSMIKHIDLKKLYSIERGVVVWCLCVRVSVL